MAATANKSKICPSGFVYLVPGSIGINDKSAFSASAEEEIFVDAMIAAGVATADFSNPAATLTLFEPIECEFVMPDEHLRPNHIVYDFPTAGTMTIRASVTAGVQTLNRGNSLSYRFPIKGRAGRDIKLGISVAAQPVGVLVDSCTWTIDRLGPDTLNLGGPLD